MGIIIVIRHGFSESNKKGYLTHDIEGYPLTTEGKKYLINSSEELKKLKGIKEITSSPIQRARETAEIISKITGLKIRMDERLAERQMGKYNNTPYPNNNKYSAEMNWRLKEVLSGHPNGLESWANLMKRTESLLKEIPKDEKVILVSHGDVIKAVIGHFLDLDEFGTWGIMVNHGHFTIIDTAQDKLLCIGAPIITDSMISKIKNDG